MDETSNAASAAQTNAPARAPSAHLAWGIPALVLALAALATALGLAWMGHMRLQELELQIARRIGEFDAASREARAAAKEAGSVLEGLNARVAALEAASQEAQSQQLALAAMYQELVRGQDDRVLADMEQALLLAQQHLQLGGNVRAALISLEAAEQRLARAGKPQFDPLRQAIGRDVERLKLLQAADVVGLSARLEALIQNVDALKLAAEAEPAVRPARPAPSGPVGAVSRLGQEAWEEFKQLVRIRRLDRPEPPLLDPGQAYFLRQNLKLRLLSARLAALQRDEGAWKADLGAAHAWMAEYFNPNDPLTQAMLDSLKELAAAPVAIGAADVDASLKALQAMRRHTGG